MAEPFLSEIRIMSFGFAPIGWALCAGQLLPINQNQALFSLLGTTYGGDGRVNFALPDLRGRIAIHMGGSHTLGERAGEEQHTLITSELATHPHGAIAQPLTAGAGNPGNVPGPTKLLAQAQADTSSGAENVNLYGNGAVSKVLAAQSIGMTGGNQSHENRQPYLGLNLCIALQGIFPSQT